MKRWTQALIVLTLLGLAPWAQALDGVVRDAVTGRPIENAFVVAEGKLQRSNAQGRFDFGAAVHATGISVRALGYARLEKSIQDAGALVLSLKPMLPKALYLSPYGIGSNALRGAALKLIDDTELNALVIDIKGDRGLVPFRSASLAAAGLPQTLVTVKDMADLMHTLRAHGLYLIARIVVFKDEPMATLHPQWAVHDGHGNVWKDREGLPWMDPFRREAWERNLALAEEAAQLGFDEVQFDYLRFPDATGLVFSESDTQDKRIAAIDGFLDAAQQRLLRYNVFVSADVFGYVAWNSNDTHIGQQLEAVVQHVDYLSPMLYPSGFSFGIPGHRNPVAAPYDIVFDSLQRARQRTGLPGLRFRPWLQAFRDYAFDRRAFGEREIRQQIDAANAAGTDGWMLWNAHNRYDDEGLRPELPASAPRP